MSMTAEKIKVMSAFERGEKVMCRALDLSYAAPCIGEPAWNWDAYVYSIAPKPREWWINLYGEGNTSDAAFHGSRRGADLYSPQRTECVHVREVIES